jgi:hypothetical protein
MADFSYYAIAILLAGIPAWALFSGRALGVWWRRTSFTRVHEPAAYWVVVALQFGILILVLLTGRSWHLR